MPRAPEMLIVGGGPGGCSAAVMARSLAIEVCLVDRAGVGGRVPSVARIDNLVGGPFSGPALADTWQQQLSANGVPIVLDEVCGIIRRGDGLWRTELKEGEPIDSTAVVIATGTRNMPLSEHDAVETVHQDGPEMFLEEGTHQQILSASTIIVGCDRPVVTFLKASQVTNSVTVLALPDKRYVLESMPRDHTLKVLFVNRIRSVVRTRSKATVEAIADDGSATVVEAHQLVTNLGNVPNSEPFSPPLIVDEGGFLRAPSPSDNSLAHLYVAGDVGHAAYQRIATALGEGARATLRYFYDRESLYLDKSAGAVAPAGNGD